MDVLSSCQLFAVAYPCQGAVATYRQEKFVTSLHNSGSAREGKLGAHRGHHLYIEHRGHLYIEHRGQQLYIEHRGH